MIQVDAKLVQHLSRLSRIGCPAEKLPRMVHDLEQIIRYFEALNEVPTDDVEADTTVSKFITKMPLRDDVAQNRLSQEEFLQAAPEQIAQLVRIPTVM